MIILISGLMIFLGVHSIRIVANDWRTKQIASRGEMVWKLTYSLASLIGFALIVWGFGLVRHEAYIVWALPTAMRHVTALLTLIAFILVAAAYVPRNRIKEKLHHPMLLGVKVWALAHLLVNGSLAGIILFASFLAWAIVCFSAARKRDRMAGTVYVAGTTGGTIAAVGAGIFFWALFAFWLHGMLIGVRPFS